MNEARIQQLEDRIARLEAGYYHGWVTPTLATSWTNFGTGVNAAGYRLAADGMVHLRGLLQYGPGLAVGVSAAIFTLPYRPARQEVHDKLLWTGAAYGLVRIDVTTAGVVNATPATAALGTTAAGAWISLDGLTFGVY